MHETSVGKVLCYWMNDSGVCKLSSCHTVSSGMEHDVQERWQLWPTMGSVELASPTMPRLEVWSKKWDGQEFLSTAIRNALFCSASDQVISSSVGDPERAKSVHRSDKPKDTKINPTLQFWMVLDIFKCDYVRHELLMVSAPRDVERICDGLLWCQPLAFLKSLIT